MAWDLTGNAGTTAANFLGTQDDQPLVIKTNDIEAIHINPGSLGPQTNGRALIPGNIGIPGNLGIGTTSPTAKLEVEGSADPLLLIDHTGAAGNPAMWFQQDGVTKAFAWWDQVNNRLNLGTPATNPIISFQNDGTVEMPRTLNVSGLEVKGAAIVEVLEITGGADLAEPFSVTDNAAAEPGTVVVIDEHCAGRLKVSDSAYDRKVAGIVSGGRGIRPGLTLTGRPASSPGVTVALTGRVYCKAEALSNPIEPGDLLTTSRLPGYAMKATDPAASQGAVLGKAMSPLNGGQGLILVLISLQ
jgi:hypothetical protein